MKVAGTALLPAPPERVLQVLRDPAQLVEALPNVDGRDWEAEEDGSFVATIRPALALGQAPIRTVWRPQSLGAQALHYGVEGRTDEHAVSLDATVEVRDGDDGGTVADWAVSFEVTGTMRSAGQRTIAAIVAAQSRLVLDAVGRVASAQT